VRITKAGPFSRFFGLFKKAPMEDFDSDDAGDVGNKAINKGPVDSEEFADLKDSLARSIGADPVLMDRRVYSFQAAVSGDG